MKIVINNSEKQTVMIVSDKVKIIDNQVKK